MQLSDSEASKLLVTLGQIDERTKNLEKAVLGNGQPGLKQKIDQLESDADKAKGRYEVRYQISMWFAGTALGGKIVEWIYHLMHLGSK